MTQPDDSSQQKPIFDPGAQSLTFTIVITPAEDPEQVGPTFRVFTDPPTSCRQDDWDQTFRDCGVPVRPGRIRFHLGREQGLEALVEAGEFSERSVQLLGGYLSQSLLEMHRTLVDIATSSPTSEKMDRIARSVIRHAAAFAGNHTPVIVPRRGFVRLISHNEIPSVRLPLAMNGRDIEVRLVPTRNDFTFGRSGRVTILGVEDGKIDIAVSWLSSHKPFADHFNNLFIQALQTAIDAVMIPALQTFCADLREAALAASARANQIELANELPTPSAGRPCC